MAQAVERDSDAGSVSFEVERFVRRGPDQIELRGRWFGLRGLRFVRPTLTLAVDGQSQRALADLAHKPWAAEDGELWEAVFPIEPGGSELGAIVLTVAPDITVSLPSPGSDAADTRIPARPRRDDLLDNLRGARRDVRPRPASGNGSDPGSAGRSATRWEDELEAQREAPRAPQPQPQRRRASQPPPQPASPPAPQRAPEPDKSAALTQRLSQAQQEIERLRGELERQDNARVKARAARTRRDAAVDRLTEALAARDEALRERDRFAAERDQALRERDRALKERDRALTKPAGAHHTSAHTRRGKGPLLVWSQRLLAVAVLIGVVIAIAITIHVL
jgi:hypothetical protein